MHVYEDQHVGSENMVYNQADEESTDQEYNDVDNDHSGENGNEGGHNGDSKDYGKSGARGTMIGGRSGTASISNGDGGPSNACQERVHHYVVPN
jgi:hypothetical protein